MSYQLKKVRLLSYKLHAAFTPSAHFRPKKAPRAIFSRGGGRVYFGVNGQFLCLGGPSYGHWKTMRVVLKNFFDLTPLSPYPTLGTSGLSPSARRSPLAASLHNLAEPSSKQMLILSKLDKWSTKGWQGQVQGLVFGRQVGQVSNSRLSP